MLRTFRYPLLENKAQREVLEGWRRACQQLYNGALQERRDAWKLQRVSINYNRQTRELAELRGEAPDWHAVPSNVLRSALHRVDRAFKAFFRRVKAGEKPGYPRFRAVDRYDSIGIGRVRVDGDRVMVPKLGSVRFKLYRPLRGVIRNVELKLTPKGWFVCFSCDLGAAPAKVPVEQAKRNAVGIDVGLEAFATLSDGTRIDNPRYFRKAEATLARRQQALAKKRRGSNSRRRAKKLVARAHYRIRNQRLDFARKLACDLYSKFDLICIEDLSISRMVHGILAKSIHDAAWGMFAHALTCKAEEAGKWDVAINPRGTSQICSGCGAVVHKDLSVRVHYCDRCGLRLHRDHNSAINICALGMSAVDLTVSEVP